MTAPTATRSATDKQIAFLTKLIDKTGLTFDITDELTTKEASAMIDQALEVVKQQQDAKAAAKVAPTSAPPAAVTVPVTVPVSLVKVDSRKVSDLSIVELLTLALEKAQHIGV